MNKKQSTTKKIKLLMIKKEIDNEELADHFNCTIPAISNAVNGRRKHLQEDIYNYLKQL